MIYNSVLYDDDNNPTSDQKKKVCALYCDGRYARKCKKEWHSMFTLLHCVVFGTDIGKYTNVCICAKNGCIKNHNALTIDISGYIKNVKEVVFLGKIFGLAKYQKKCILDVDIRHILTVLDYLGANQKLTLIQRTMNEYKSISLRSAASIHQTNQQHLSESNQITVTLVLDIDPQQYNHFAWFDFDVFELEDSVHLCQVFSTEQMLKHIIEDIHECSSSFGVPHILELIHVISEYDGIIAGCFAAYVAKTGRIDPVLVPEKPTVDVHILDCHNFKQHYCLKKLNEWANESGYRQDERQSTNKIVFRHEYLVPVIVWFHNRQIKHKLDKNIQIKDLLWKFDTDYNRVYIQNELWVCYLPIATMDWAGNTYTKSGFMIDTTLYPHNREHCRRQDYKLY
jgi:hypothetical protein